MKTIRSVYEDGVFRPTEPFDLPEHSVVEFEPRPLEEPEADPNLDSIDEIPSRRDNSERGGLAARSSGIREEDWPDTPERIARHLLLMDRIEPMEVTPEEEADWETFKRARRDLEKARFDEQAEALRQGWE